LGRKSNQATEERNRHILKSAWYGIAEKTVPALAEASPKCLTRSLSRRDADETTTLDITEGFFMRAILILQDPPRQTTLSEPVVFDQVPAFRVRAGEEA